MKKLFKETLSSIKILALAFILALGIGMVSAATWQGPTASPPGGNVDAPLNVSSAEQEKPGILRLAGLYTEAFRLVDGNQGAGKVLTSDADGVASWQESFGGSSVTAYSDLSQIKYRLGQADSNYEQVFGSNSAFQMIDYTSVSQFDNTSNRKAWVCNSGWTLYDCGYHRDAGAPDAGAVIVEYTTAGGTYHGCIATGVNSVDIFVTCAQY